MRANLFLGTVSRVYRFTLAIVAIIFSPMAAGHGFGQRYDLPVPLWLWVISAGATVVLSFFIVGVVRQDAGAATTYSRVNLLKVGLIRCLAHWLLLGLLRVLAVIFLIATVVAGFVGSPDPFYNLAPVVVWVVWWVGMAFVCALIGDLWSLINPFRMLFFWAECAFARLTKRTKLSLARSYPPTLAMWPAVAGLLIFFWAELIWSGGSVPRNIAIAVIIYAVATWSGMFVYGRDVWLQNADTFSIVFGILARFAPLELRVANDTTLISTCTSPACRNKTLDCVNGYRCLVKAPTQREWNLRPPGLGLLNDQQVTFSMMILVIVLLAAVTFDGLLETRLWTHILDRTLPGEIRWVGSVALVLFSSGFLLIYLIFCGAMHRFAERYDDNNRAGHPRSTIEVASAFVLTLVPIAIAYHLAHYLSYLVITGQYLIPRMSDPFGYGWNLFGTTDYKVDIGLLSARMAWYLAVTFVVLGHGFAVYLAHVVAGRVFGMGRVAFLSQIPMVVLMVLYTMVSLWILAQPMVV